MSGFPILKNRISNLNLSDKLNSYKYFNPTFLSVNRGKTKAERNACEVVKKSSADLCMLAVFHGLIF